MRKQTQGIWILCLTLLWLSSYSTQLMTAHDSMGSSGLVRSFKLLPTPSGVAHNNSDYGQAVDLDAGRAIIAAKNAQYSGAVFILEQQQGSWQRVATLQPPVLQGFFDLDFGTAVGISGDWAVVSVYDENHVGFTAGAAMLYQYENQAWQYKQTIRASDYDQGGVGDTECFGCALAISGNKLVIGSERDDDPNTNYGSAYVFHLNDGVWTEQQKLTASVGYANDRFGIAVDIDDNQIVVGATGWDQKGNPNGSAFVYGYDGQSWIETQILNASDGMVRHQFGAAVAIDNDTIMVGATRALNQGQVVSGAVYVFDKDQSSWVETDKLTPNGDISGESFGFNIDLKQDRVVIAATKLGLTSDDNAYVYQRDNQTWTETAVLSPNDELGGQVGVYGISVALSEDDILIGSQRLYLSAGQTNITYAYNYDGTDWQEELLMPAESAAGDTYGYRLDYLEPYLAVSAPGDDVWDQINGERFGSVYIHHFDGNQWILDKKIKNPTLNDHSDFGHEVMLHDDKIYISAIEENNNGAVFIYQKTNDDWVLIQTIEPTDSTNNFDGFGQSLAISNDTLMIGSNFNSPNGKFNEEFGAVYVYQWDGNLWQKAQKLSKPNPIIYDYFGHSISIDNDVAVIGARLSDANSQSDSGSALVFTRDNGTWSFEQELTASDPQSFAGFGAGVLLKGNRLLVRSSTLSSGIGFTYVFGYDGTEWTEQTKLIPSEDVFGSHYSTSFALHQDTLMIGNQQGQTGTSNSGSVFVFEFDGMDWIEQDIIKQELPSWLGDEFGSDIYFDDNHLIIGAQQKNTHGSSSGAVYVESILSDVIFTDGFD